MIVAIDLGATGIKVAPFDKTRLDAGEDPRIGRVLTVPTDASSGKEGVVRALDRAVRLYLGEETEGLAVSTAGNTDTGTATITYATGNLPGMTGFSYAEFARGYGLPVSAINDAHAALLGELYDGAAREYSGARVIMLTLGSGVGGAYAAAGRIVSDEKNDYARFGHICLIPGGFPCTCGKVGCAEMYLSGRAIHRDAKSAGIDGDDLFLRYLAGDPRCVSFAERFRERLAALLEKIRPVCPYDVCIIGGGVADWMGDAFPELTGGLGVPVIRASLGNMAGVYGAFRHYMSGEVVL